MSRENERGGIIELKFQLAQIFFSSRSPWIGYDNTDIHALSTPEARKKKRQQLPPRKRAELTLMTGVQASIWIIDWDYKCLLITKVPEPIVKWREWERVRKGKEDWMV